MNIVVLDGYTLNPGDLNWSALEALGSLSVYDRTAPQEVVERAGEADAVIVNKQKLSAETLEMLPNLKYIGVSATGVNNVDLDAAKSRGIRVTNVGGYSTFSVAQHTFGLILALANHLELHGQSVQRGEWVSAKDWCYKLTPLVELNGKTLGLVGLGAIGEAVAHIGRSFGMRIVAYRRNAAKGFPDGIEPVSLEELFATSDVVSLHCPLTPETQGLVNENTLALMKKSAYLINTGRGPLIVEEALANALREGKIAGAGLDVLSEEPPRADNPLLKAPNCIITPHIAWSTFEARTRLMKTVAENLEHFIAGNPRNIVV